MLPLSACADSRMALTQFTLSKRGPVNPSDLKNMYPIISWKVGPHRSGALC